MGLGPGDVPNCGKSILSLNPPVRDFTSSSSLFSTSSLNLIDLLLALSFNAASTSVNRMCTILFKNNPLVIAKVFH